MPKVKGVIIAAGYGTRFLPATKTLPKEMLPLVNKPSIQFIVEEMVAAGIEDILVISSRRKKVLEDFFDREIELESTFKAEGATKKLAALERTKCNVAFVRQEEMRGTGHAMLCAEPFLGGSPFVMAFPDDIFLGDPPVSKQLVDVHNKTGCSVLSLYDEPGDVSRYGVVEAKKEGDLLRILNFVEKPARGTEPSHLVSLGRYLITPDVFPHLHKSWPTFKGKEFYHLEGVLPLIREGRVLGHVSPNLRLDTGEPLGYVQGMIEYALTQPEWRQPLLDFMAAKLKK